jgi:diphthamide biosynthesis methyltransferase
MLYVIGLGLSDEKDITVKGLEVSLLLVSLSQSILNNGHRLRDLSGREEMRKSVP